MSHTTCTTSFTNPFAQWLAKFGLIKKAARIERSHDGFQTFFRWANGRTEGKFHSLDAMLRTERKYALVQAQKQFKRLLPMRTLIDTLPIRDGDGFSTFEFSIPWSDDPREGPESKFIEDTREYIGAALDLSSSKTVTRGKFLTIKVINAFSYDEQTVKLIRDMFLSDAPPGAEFSHWNHAKSAFESQLRRFVAHDLPEDDDESRAKLEYVLEDKHQIVIHNQMLTTICLRRKDSNKLDDIESLKSPVPPRPRDPETGELATYYTFPQPRTRKAEDLNASDWIQFPDFEEVDATTAAESAEMSAMIN